MTSQTTIRIKVKLAWWVRPYLKTLSFLCELHDCEPDMEKVMKTITRGLRVKVG